jgi:LuxR family maltose regulon positive regulatory protein
LRGAGFLADAVGGATVRADIRIAQGRLRDAQTIYEQGLQLSAEHGDPVLPGTPDMYVGLAELARERGDLDAAARHLQTSRDLGDHLGFPQHRYRLAVATARVRHAQRDLAGAMELLHEAARVYVSDFHPDVRPLGAMIALLCIAEGRLPEARAWARERGLSPGDDLTYLREFEHVTLARLLLAERSPREALELLGRLLGAAEEGERTGSVVEILVLQALAGQQQGEVRGALVPLERALSLAEPEGYVRVFADEGAPMAALLEAAAKQGIAPTYVRRLLAAISGGAEHRTPPRQALIEPLSERELDVLRLLASDLDGPAIAAELVVSLNTVRTHTKNIYAKLGVNNRRAAVSRATEIDLLSRARDR